MVWNVSDEDDLKDLKDLGTQPARVRRVDGARRELEDAVVFRQGEKQIEGWCLNMSRGGLRAVLDTAVEVDEEFDVTIGEETETRRARIVWVRATGGGAIVGVSFEDEEGSVPPTESVD